MRCKRGRDMNDYPKVSIVTVCYNSEKYIEDCIKSVMNQTYKNVEHIIVDGKSTDHTVDIIKRYDGLYNMRWISEKDSGMYEAIFKGFKMATGDIYAWLNSDDMYMPWACELVAIVMSKVDIQWCTGIPCHYTEQGIAYNIPRVTPVFPQKYIQKGYMDGRIASFLEQESMFWSKGLWNKCGKVILNYKYAGDYHLWREFSKYQPLITLDSIISGFRIHDGQKSSDRTKYYNEIGTLSLFKRILQKTKIISILLLFSSIFAKKFRLRTFAVLKD